MRGSHLLRSRSIRVRSKSLPLTDRVALAAKRRLRDAVSSPPKQGEREKECGSGFLLPLLQGEKVAPERGREIGPGLFYVARVKPLKRGNTRDVR